MRIIMFIIFYVLGMLSIMVAVGTGVLAALRVFFGVSDIGSGTDGGGE